MSIFDNIWFLIGLIVVSFVIAYLVGMDTKSWTKDDDNTPPPPLPPGCI